MADLGSYTTTFFKEDAKQPKTKAERDAYVQRTGQNKKNKKNSTPAAGNTTSVTGDVIVSNPPAQESFQTTSTAQSNSMTLESSPSSKAPVPSITAASPKERFAMTPVGEFVSGVVQGSQLRADPQGRDTRNLPIAEGTGVLAGLVANLWVLGSGNLNAVLGDTAVAKSFRVGKAGPFPEVKVPSFPAQKIAVNTASAKKTASWLGRLASASSNPQAVVGGLMAAIGSYPFAGFIKEEALQTSSFAVKSALDNNDIAGAESAIALQKEILNPDLWGRIYAGVPMVNVLTKLKDFYKAARVKLAIDEQVVADKKRQLETGESDNDYYERVNTQREDSWKSQEEEIENSFAEVQRLIDRAVSEQRKSDEAYWRGVLAKKDKYISDLKKANDDFWSMYYETLQKNREANVPSNLKFGLL